MTTASRKTTVFREFVGKNDEDWEIRLLYETFLQMAPHCMNVGVTPSWRPDGIKNVDVE